MLLTPNKKFVHPHEVYELEYPAHWDQLQEDNARSCGFGPHDRDDVGLWLSIMPMSLDTSKLVDELPKLMQQTLAKSQGENMRHDTSLRHYGLKADITKDGQGGHYWILAGGDVVLFASTEVPAAEREQWNPLFEKVMASLRITRDDELLKVQAAGEVVKQLRERQPDQDFKLEEKGIRGKNQMVYLTNLYRELLAEPSRYTEIIKNFVDNLTLSSKADMGHEVWEECRGHILPVLKPRDYVDKEGPAKHLLVTEWLADVVICYVIKSNKFFRFVTGWDVNRWGTTSEALHDLSIENLRALSWPSRLEGARQPDGGRVILVETKDGLSSSRILHPDFHKLFSGPLGSPFWAGIPDRETLVTYSNRRSLKQRIPRRLKKDHDSSAYPITPRPFLVTRDGIALPEE